MRSILLFPLIVGSVFAQEPRRNITEVRLDEASLKKVLKDRWICRLRYDGLPKSSDCHITVPLTHDAESEIEILGSKTSCSCAKAQLTPSNWKAGKKAELEIWLKTPDFTNKALLATSVEFDARINGKKVKLAVGFKSMLSNVFGFKSANSFLEVDIESEVQNFEVPFVCTLPNPSFKVTSSKELPSGDVTITKKEDWYITQLETPTNLVPAGGTIGTLNIADEKSGQSISSSISVIIPTPVEIAPLTIRFRETAGQMVGTGMLRLRKPMTEILVGVKVKDLVAPAKVVKLNDLIYRVTIRIPKQVYQENKTMTRILKGKLDWSVNLSADGDNERFELKTNYAIFREVSED